jgi:hypothetical protein
MDTLPVRPVEEFAETNKPRGGRKNRKALSNLREAVHSPVYQSQWMTPRACEAQNPPMGVDKRHHGLTHQVTKTWATPRANERDGTRTPNGNPKKDGIPLGMQAQQWATPQAKDHKSGHRDPTIVQYKQLNVEVEARATGKLNPRWVETLMGLPIGWTMPSCTSPQTIAPMSCDSSAMESCPPPRSELSEFSLAS